MRQRPPPAGGQRQIHWPRATAATAEKRVIPQRYERVLPLGDRVGRDHAGGHSRNGQLGRDVLSIERWFHGGASEGSETLPGATALATEATPVPYGTSELLTFLDPPAGLATGCPARGSGPGTSPWGCAMAWGFTTWSKRSAVTTPRVTAASRKPSWWAWAWSATRAAAS